MNSPPFIMQLCYCLLPHKASIILDYSKVQNYFKIIAHGELLPLEVVFKGTTTCTLPPMNIGRQICIGSGWDLAYNDNHHQFTLDTMQQICRENLLTLLAATNPAIKAQQRTKNWCGFGIVHMSQEFLDWIKTKH